MSLVLTLAPPTPADADIAGRFRLHLETPILEYEHTREWVGPNEAPRNEDWSDDVWFGPGAGGFALGFGYAITKRLVVGGTLAMTLRRDRHMSYPPGGFTTTQQVDLNASILVRPYLEYVLLPHARVRPYGFVRGGISAHRYASTDLLGQYDSLRWSMRPQLGGGAGVHVFVIPRVSLDLMAYADHTFVLTKATHAYDAFPDDAHVRPWYQETELGLGFGLSLWLGGKRR
ncbi:hypothetical protein ACNOYE_25620 [Nannocystaceae bacterium ST9]